MTSDQMKYFLEIVERNSFSKAAEELYLSQSSLSKQIKSLENELGQRLFIRNGAHIELTDGGRLFLKYAKKAYVEHLDFLRLLNKVCVKQTDVLRLGVLPVLFGYDFMDIISKFQMHYEKTQLVLHENGQEALMKMLDNRQLDAVIAYSDFIPPQKYEFVPANYDDLSVACSRKHPFACYDVLSLEQIKNERLIILEEHASIIYQMLYNACLAEGFVPTIASTSNRHEHLLSMLQENAGIIAMLPRKLSVRESKYMHGINVVPLNDKIYTTTSIIRLKAPMDKPCLVEFIEYWAEEIKKQQPAV